MAKPKIIIEYCTQCNWLLRSAWMAQELLNTFSLEIGELVLKPGSGGIFKIFVNNKNLTLREEPGSFNFITPLGGYVESIIGWNDDVCSNFKLKELDFMTKPKAIEQVTAIFKTLNIHICIL